MAVCPGLLVPVSSGNGTPVVVVKWLGPPSHLCGLTVGVVLQEGCVNAMLSDGRTASIATGYAGGVVALLVSSWCSATTCVVWRSVLRLWHLPSKVCTVVVP